MISYLATPGSKTTLYKVLSSKKVIGTWVPNRQRLPIFQSATPSVEDHFKTTSEGLSGEFFNAHIREKYKFERIA